MLHQGNLLAAVALLSICMLPACSGIQHEMPDADFASERQALAEIEAYRVPESETMLEGAAAALLFDVYARVKPAATEVCRHVDEVRYCSWQLQFIDSSAFEAYAMPGNVVYVSQGVIARMDSEDELAFVLAHELSHHIADHLGESKKQRMGGSALAALAVGAMSAGTGGCYTYACQQGLQNIAANAMQAGAAMGDLTFNKAQEKEADFLAAHILSLAGYDLALSRPALVKIGAMVDDRETSFTDTHPAGPERLANYDEFIEVVRNDVDGYPGSEPAGKSRATEASQPPVAEPESVEIDPKKCRYYLKEQNLCIH